MANLNSALRRLIFRLRGGVARAPRQDAVIQTGLNRPRDLDDPFSDPKAQERVARMIAEKAGKKSAGKY